MEIWIIWEMVPKYLLTKLTKKVTQLLRSTWFDFNDSVIKIPKLESLPWYLLT